MTGDLKHRGDIKHSDGAYYLDCLACEAAYRAQYPTGDRVTAWQKRESLIQRLGRVLSSVRS